MSDSLPARPSTAELLGQLAHDLRTPIHRLIGFSKLAIEDFDSLPPAQLRHFIERVLESGLRVRDMVDQLIDVAALESGRLRLQPQALNLSELLRESAAAMHDRLTARGLQLQLELPETAPAVLDAERLREVFQQLLEHAIGNSVDGGHIDLRLHHVADGNWVVEVDDHGPGLLDQDLAVLFERLAPGRRQTGNPAGLGLPIARGLVEAHNGQLSASRHQGGIRLQAVLPAR